CPLFPLFLRRTRMKEGKDARLVVLVAVAAVPEHKEPQQQQQHPGPAATRPLGPRRRAPGPGLPDNTQAGVVSVGGGRRQQRGGHFLSFWSRRAVLCPMLLRSFAPRQPWPSPSTNSTRALPPAFRSRAARSLDCSEGTTWSSVPCRNRKGGGSLRTYVAG